MMNMIKLQCPGCGATLEVDDSRQYCFCSYCGTKIMVQNENEYIYRRIDEAEVAQAETDRMIRMKQLEYLEKKRIDDEKTKKLKIIISLALAAIGVPMMVFGGMAGSASGDPDSGYHFLSLVGFFLLLGVAYIWLFSANKDDDDDLAFGDKAKVPESISDYEKKNFSAIEAMFLSAGFTNVTCIPLNDLTLGVLKRPGLVDSVTANGREVTSGGKKFPKDAAVVINIICLL